MNEKNIKLFKQINIWVYIIPFFLITALFSLRTYNAVEQKRDYPRFCVKS